MSADIGKFLVTIVFTVIVVACVTIRLRWKQFVPVDHKPPVAFGLRIVIGVCAAISAIVGELSFTGIRSESGIWPAVAGTSLGLCVSHYYLELLRYLAKRHDDRKAERLINV